MFSEGGHSLEMVRGTKLIIRAVNANSRGHMTLHTHIISILSGAHVEGHTYFKGFAQGAHTYF